MHVGGPSIGKHDSRRKMACWIRKSMVPWDVHAFPGAKPAHQMLLPMLRCLPIAPMVRSFALILVLIALVGSNANAETINVPADQPTIQAAIEAASDGDTVLVASGTYSERIDFLGKAILVKSTIGSFATTIDASGVKEWSNWPRDSAVRFIRGEGPGAVLQGFTVTGMVGWSSAVHCAWPSSPRILDCSIEDNAVHTAAIYGSPYVEGCTISGTRGYLGYGGVGIWTEHGATIVDCLFYRNVCNDAPGVAVMAYGPTTVTDCVLSENEGDSGSSTIWGPVPSAPIKVTGSVFFSNMLYLKATTPNGVVKGADLVDHCTFWGNSIPGGHSYVVYGSNAVRNSIAWGNTVDAIDQFSVGLVEYSNVGGGHPGVGNIDQDPLLRAPVFDDFSLLPESPCIDAGDPNSSLDPDGTRADMGAFYFPQSPASSTVRNGSGVNALFLSSVTDPVLGTDWTADVDCSGHNPAFAALELYEQPFSGYFLSGGELLVDVTSPSVSRSLQVHFGGVVSFSFAVPDDLALSGFEASAQAVVLGAPGYELSNALDLVAGY